MEHEYTLLRHKDKRCHFARVTVHAESRNSGIEIVEKIREPLKPERCEVNRRGHADWIDAALCGARSSAQALLEQKQIDGCCIAVTCVVGTLVDTSPQTVACAAALATWQALNPNAVLPPFDFYDGKWHIKFDGN